MIITHLRKQIYTLNHKSNDKHGKPVPIKNTCEKKVIDNRGENLTPINEHFGSKIKKVNY